jgi:hypothetical protein
MMNSRTFNNAQRLKITVHHVHYRNKVAPKGNYLTNNYTKPQCMYDLTSFLHKKTGNLQAYNTFYRLRGCVIEVKLYKYTYT